MDIDVQMFLCQRSYVSYVYLRKSAKSIKDKESCEVINTNISSIDIYLRLIR